MCIRDSSSITATPHHQHQGRPRSSLGSTGSSSEMGTASLMSVVLSGNCRIRLRSPQHHLQCHSSGRLSSMAHDLSVLSSIRFQLVFIHHQFDTNCISCKRGVTRNSTQPHKKSRKGCALQPCENYISGQRYYCCILWS